MGLICSGNTHVKNGRIVRSGSANQKCGADELRSTAHVSLNAQHCDCLAPKELHWPRHVLEVVEDALGCKYNSDIVRIGT